MMKKRVIFLLVLILLIGWFIQNWVEGNRQFVEIHLANLRSHPIIVTRLQYQSIPHKDVNIVMPVEKYASDAIFTDSPYDPNDPNFILEFTDSVTKKSYKYEFTMINNWYFETCAYSIILEDNGFYLKGCDESTAKGLY